MRDLEGLPQPDIYRLHLSDPSLELNTDGRPKEGLRPYDHYANMAQIEFGNDSGVALLRSTRLAAPDFINLWKRALAQGVAPSEYVAASFGSGPENVAMAFLRTDIAGVNLIGSDIKGTSSLRWFGFGVEVDDTTPFEPFKDNPAVAPVQCDVVIAGAKLLIQGMTDARTTKVRPGFY